MRVVSNPQGPPRSYVALVMKMTVLSYKSMDFQIIPELLARDPAVPRKRTSLP